MRLMYRDGDHVRLSEESAGDIPEELRGVTVRIIERVAFSHRYNSPLFSVETVAGQHWVVRGDWFDQSIETKTDEAG